MQNFITILCLLSLLLPASNYAQNRIYFYYGDTQAPGPSAVYGADRIYFHKITVDTYGILDSCNVYVTLSNPGTSIKAALYRDNAGQPGSIIDSTRAITPVDNIFNKLKFVNGKNIKAGVYHIAVNASLGYIRAKGEGGSVNFREQAFAYAGGWPSTAAAGAASGNNNVDVYITLFRTLPKLAGKDDYPEYPEFYIFY